MAIKSISQLKAWFSRGKYPTQAQFADWLDSYVHKQEGEIPMSRVDGLTDKLNGKYAADEGRKLKKGHDDLKKEYEEHLRITNEQFRNIAQNIDELETDTRGYKLALEVQRSGAATPRFSGEVEQVAEDAVVMGSTDAGSTALGAEVVYAENLNAFLMRVAAPVQGVSYYANWVDASEMGLVQEDGMWRPKAGVLYRATQKPYGLYWFDSEGAHLLEGTQDQNGAFESSEDHDADVRELKQSIADVRHTGAATPRFSGMIIEVFREDRVKLASAGFSSESENCRVVYDKRGKRFLLKYRDPDLPDSESFVDYYANWADAEAMGMHTGDDGFRVPVEGVEYRSTESPYKLYRFEQGEPVEVIEACHAVVMDNEEIPFVFDETLSGKIFYDRQQNRFMHYAGRDYTYATEPYNVQYDDGEWRPPMNRIFRCGQQRYRYTGMELVNIGLERAGSQRLVGKAPTLKAHPGLIYLNKGYIRLCRLNTGESFKLDGEYYLKDPYGDSEKLIPLRELKIAEVESGNISGHFDLGEDHTIINDKSGDHCRLYLAQLPEQCRGKYISVRYDSRGRKIFAVMTNYPEINLGDDDARLYESVIPHKPAPPDLAEFKVKSKITLLNPDGKRNRFELSWADRPKRLQVEVWQRKNTAVGAKATRDRRIKQWRWRKGLHPKISGVKGRRSLVIHSRSCVIRARINRGGVWSDWAKFVCMNIIKPDGSAEPRIQAYRLRVNKRPWEKVELFVDLFVRMGGEYHAFSNPEEPFWLNGLDLTYEQAMDCVIAGTPAGISKHAGFYAGNKVIRTNLPMQFYEQNLTSANDMFAGCSAIEVISTGKAELCIGQRAFKGCAKLRRIKGTVRCNGSTADSFSGCVNLEQIDRLIPYRASGAIDLSDCPKLNIETFRQMFSETGSGARTYKVHPDIYAKITDDTNEQWHALLSTITSKQITLTTTE